MFGPNPSRVVFEFKHNVVIVSHPIFMFGKPKFLWHCWASTGVQLFFKCFNHTEGMIGHSTTSPCIRSGSSVWCLSGWSEASVPPIESHVGKRSKKGNFTKEKCERNNQFIVSGCYLVEIQNWMDVCFCTAIIGQHTLPLVGWDLNKNSGLSTRILKMDVRFGIKCTSSRCIVLPVGVNLPLTNPAQALLLLSFTSMQPQQTSPWISRRSMVGGATHENCISSGIANQLRWVAHVYLWKLG